MGPDLLPVLGNRRPYLQRNTVCCTWIVEPPRGHWFRHWLVASNWVCHTDRSTMSVLWWGLCRSVGRYHSNGNSNSGGPMWRNRAMHCGRRAALLMSLPYLWRGRMTGVAAMRMWNCWLGSAINEKKKGIFNYVNSIIWELIFILLLI